jgi:hypothetical protein
MKLAKPWDWRPNTPFYNHPSEVVHERYPFYWYRVTGLQIELVKQISLYFGVVQAENFYVDDKPAVNLSSTEDMYIDQRSWLTLGEYTHDPIDPISVFNWGDKKVELCFTPDGQLFTAKEWVKDKLTYWAALDYSKKKDKYFVNRYRNMQGVEAVKSDGTWNWISGKPVIDKKYGQRK